MMREQISVRRPVGPLVWELEAHGCVLAVPRTRGSTPAR